MNEHHQPVMQIDEDATDLQRQRLTNLQTVLSENPVEASKILHESATFAGVVAAAETADPEDYRGRLLGTVVMVWEQRADGVLGFDAQTDRELRRNVPKTPDQKRYHRIAGYAGLLAAAKLAEAEIAIEQPKSA